MRQAELCRLSVETAWQPCASLCYFADAPACRANTVGDFADGVLRRRAMAFVDRTSMMYLQTLVLVYGNIYISACAISVAYVHTCVTSGIMLFFC